MCRVLVRSCEFYATINKEIALAKSSTVLTSTVGQCYLLFLCQFCCQDDAEFDSFGEAGFLVMPAELQDFLQKAKATGFYEMNYIKLATGLR